MLVGSQRRTKRTTSIPNHRRHHQTLFGILEDVQNERNEDERNEERQDDETSSSPPPSSSNPGNESNNEPISTLRASTDITSTDDDEEDDTEMETTTNTKTPQPVAEVDLSTYIKIVSELKENNYFLETLRASTDITSTDDNEEDDTGIMETTARTKPNTQPVVEVDLATYIEIVSELKENNFLLETLIFSSIDGGGDVRNEIATNLEEYSNPKFLQYLAQLLEDSKDPEEQEAYQELIDIIEDYSI